MRVNGYPAAELPRQQLLEALSVLTPRALPFQPDEEPVVRPPARRRDPAEGVDWELVVQLRRQASEQINENSQHWAGEHGRPMPTDDRRMMGRAVIRAVVRDHAQRLSQSGEQLWALSVEHAYANAVEDAIFGYGRLQPLFEIPTAENIEIHGWDCVTVQHGDGRRVAHPPVADSDEELVEAIRFLGASASPARAFDDAHPMMTLALGDRFRLHAVGFGLSYRPSIVIRQHLLTEVSLDQLAGGAMMPQPVAQLLADCVLARKSIVISGDQGAGKTTLLRALVAAIPTSERIGTLETDYELLTHLLPNRRNMIALQAKVGLGEYRDGRSVGEYTVADLIPEALRQNLSRLIVGEVRGAEAGALFESLQSGAGTMCTTHSHSAASTMDRLAARVAQGGVFGVDEAYRQIALNLHLLVHVRLVDDTWRGGVRRRFISEIRELTGAVENGRPVTHLAYATDEQGRPREPQPSAGLLAELRSVRGWS